jgi:hypothetical protein
VTEKLRAEIAALPGDDGWWHTAGADAFEGIAETLLARGLSEKEIINVLDIAWSAVAAEFGN